MQENNSELETKGVLNKLRLTQNLILLASLALIVTLVVFFTLNKQQKSKIINTFIVPPLSPTPTVTQIENIENWKTYKNDKYGFEIKHPSFWENLAVNSEGVIVKLGEHYEGGEPGSSSPLVFYISTQPYETTFAQDIQNDGTKIINKESVKIDNKTFYLSTHKQFEVESAYKIIDYIPIKNLKLDDLYLYFSHTSAGCSNVSEEWQSDCQQNNESNISKYRNIRNQILSTFKFLKESPTNTPNETIPQITTNELNRGWYWGMEDQKKPGTPNDWVHQSAGFSSCWHKPNVSCTF